MGSTAGTALGAVQVPAQRRPEQSPSGGWRPLGRRLLHELVLVGVLMLVYSAARLLALDDVGQADAHARALLALEHALHLPREQDVQAVLLGPPLLARGANGYYRYAHGTVTAAVLLWLFVRHPATYLWARRSLVTATAAALLVYLLLPVTPPRLLAGHGFVDLPARYGQSVYGAPGEGLTNQYASLPSMHVGWALLLAVAAVTATHGRRRCLWLAHPALTLLVVVATGNHYWLDTVAGAAFVTVALLHTQLVAVLPLPSRRPG